MSSKQHVVLFVDMLGFAALTERHPDPLVHRRSGHWQTTETSESASQFGRFHAVVNKNLELQLLDGTLTAMVFSDCAFMILGPALYTALCATALMRDFIKVGVPVRMGLASGTFHVVRLSADTYGSSNLTRALFAGTGIVRAHDAEAHGGKGMRIFVHPSMARELASIRLRVAVLPLPKPSNAAQWELSYLSEEDPTETDSTAAEKRDAALWAGTIKIQQAVSASIPAKVAIHYRETFAAINRMRRGAGQTPFKGSRRE